MNRLKNCFTDICKRTVCETRINCYKQKDMNNRAHGFVHA
ncbi:hypothetical protein BC792_10824 [Sphingobacterium allocomposti]|uniref:Uncharacterized protein n=1 Tax=Sphingobacterium allocomposti TaxID=415956 RepID=A0A5S5DIY2_9SPHI|nr:hypothetical protein BC792_10824 [Sphingobacterium composti Yoo et al. 2007 non Ten et al. 2007]